MDIQKKQGEHSTVVLNITIDSSDVKSYEAQALKKLSSEVKLDGFRSGHVPTSMIRSRVGEAAIEQECVDIAINEAYKKALQQEKIIPLDRAEVKVESVSPLKIEFTVPVFPEVSVVKTGLDAFAITNSEVTLEEIDATIEMFQKNFSEKKSVERVSQNGDVVEIDFDGKNAEGITQPGMKSESHLLELGSKTFIPGFEEELIGMKKSDEKTFPITFPSDYQAKEYAGKEFFFTVIVKEVQEKVLPEVNDAFVKQLTGKDETVEDLKNEIKIHLIEQKKREEYTKKQQELFEAIGENTTAEIPQIMILEEIETIIDNFKMQGLQMGLPWEKYLEMTGKTLEEMEEESRPQAEKIVKSRLGLRKLLDDEKIEVPEEEIKNEIHRELSTVAANKRKEKEHYFEKGNEGWFQVENRLQIRMFFRKMLVA